MRNEIEVTKVITDMFLAFPAASKTSADQVRVYVQTFAAWPASVVAKAIAAARQDPKRNKTFPPSVDEIAAKIKTTGMTAQERQQRVALAAANADAKRLAADAKVSDLEAVNNIDVEIVK